MKLVIEGSESAIEAIARQSEGMIDFNLTNDYNYVVVGDRHDPDSLELDHDQIIELIENLSELSSHMGEIG
jgi:hypothetical protein